MRRGQAIAETLVAMLAIMLVFAGAHRVSSMLAAKTMLDHAAARAARAKAVGFNDFMCEKTARAALIPVSGRRTWPGDPGIDEPSRVPIYLESEDRARANGVLEYEWWPSTAVAASSGSGVSPAAVSRVSMETDDFALEGSASVESHFPFYMDDGGR